MNITCPDEELELESNCTRVGIKRNISTKKFVVIKFVVVVTSIGIYIHIQHIALEDSAVQQDTHNKSQLGEGHCVKEVSCHIHLVILILEHDEVWFTAVWLTMAHMQLLCRVEWHEEKYKVP